MKKGRSGEQLPLFDDEIPESDQARDIARDRNSGSNGPRVVAEARGRHSSVVVGKTDSGGKYVAFLCGGRAGRKRRNTS